MKNLSIIACVSQDLGLGVDNHLLWQLKPDMQFFRATTLGHLVVMGSRTYQSIGHPLPQRENIILTRGGIDMPEKLADGTTIKIFHDRAALDQYLETTEGEKFIIGGASLYQMYLDLADKLYLTEVAANKPADAFFPTFDRSKYTHKVLQTGAADNIQFEIIEYTRKAN